MKQVLWLAIVAILSYPYRLTMENDMRDNTLRICGSALVIALILICSAACASSSSAQSITDMTGRTLSVPDPVSGVLSTAPPTTMTIYMLAPDKLLGFNSDSNTTAFMPDTYRSIPNVGGWFGKTTGNYETFLAMDPDAVIQVDLGTGDFAQTLDDRQQKFGSVPVIGVLDARNVTGYDPSIRFLGSLLDAETEADSLLEFYHRVLSQVQKTALSIPDDQKVSVYYAEGPAGLQTDPAGSTHSELIELAGGVNIADCPITPGMGMTQVSMEQVSSWNPDIIIVGDPGFYGTIFTDPVWKTLKAVQNGRVYLVPQSPFTWFDRPPGVNRILGIPWTAQVLYPDLYQDLDLGDLTREFYSKFYHYDLSDSDIDSLLNP